MDRLSAAARSQAKFWSLAALAAMLLIVAVAQMSYGAVVTWTGGGLNDNWSNPSNWSGGTPGGNDALFNQADAAATAGTVTNIVDSSVAVNSLTYAFPVTSGSTSSLHHTTQINSGNTLTVNGAFVAGILASGATPNTTHTTASITFKGDTPGVGALVINAGANDIVMGPSDGTYNNGDRNTTIDMRDLGTFTASTDGYFYLGSGHADPVTLYLAGSNTITANKFTMGPWNATDTVYLGQSNVLSVNTITMGGDVPGASNINAATSIMQFRPAGLTNPTVTIRDKAGTGVASLSAATLTVGLGANQNSNMTATLDLTGSGGSVDAVLKNLIVGQGFPNMATGSSGTGTLTFGAGTIDADIVRVGYTTSNTRAGNNGIGTLNMQGAGTLIVGSLTLGDQDPAGLGTATGTVNLNGGTLRAATIQKGAGTGTFNWSAGSIGNKLGGDLTIAASMPLTLQTSASHIFNAETGRTINANSIISESGAVAPVAKTGAGTLALNAGNLYSGATTLSEGKLVIGATNAIRSGNALAIDGTTPNTGASANTSLDVNYDQTLGSLSYLFTNANGANYQHTTTIATGRTLTVNGAFSSGVVPAELPPGNAAVGRLNITGAGALVVNAAANDINVGTSVYGWPTGVRNFTLDMTGLGSFAATTTARFYLGHGSNDNTTLTLPGSSTITANTLALGGWGSTSTINLGQSGTLNVNAVTVAGGVPTAQSNGGNGVIRFAPGLIGPTVIIRDAAGTGRANVTVGLGGDTNTANTGTLDLTGGSVDARFGTLIVGQGFPNATVGAGGTGTAKFGAGTVDATTVRVGYVASGTKSGNFGTGQLDIGGTTFIADALVLGNQQSSVASGPAATGTLNLNSGSLAVTTLTVADQQTANPAVGTVNLNGGALRATTIQKGAGSGTAAFNWSGGTIGNKLGGDLTINANMPLTLLTTASHIFDAETGRTITVNSAISESGAAAPITKTGAGTLILTSDLDYTGGTTVDGGILRLAQASLPFPSVGSTGQFGSAHTVTVNANGRLQLGATWASGDGLANQVVVNGGTLEFYNSDNYLGNIVLNGGNVITTGGAQPWRTGYFGNGQITTSASASSSTIAGTLHFVANGATATKTTFTVADGAAADDLVVSAAIRDLGPSYAGMSLVKDGTGRMVLSGVNTYAGLTNIVAGQLQTQGGSAISDASNMTIQSGASLRVYHSEAINGLAGPAGGQVVMDNGANSLTVGAAGGGGTFSGSTAGTGRLIKTGAGTQTLSGDLDHTGGTTVDGGILLLNQASVPFPIVGSTGQFGSAHTVTINAGGKLQLGAWWVSGDGLANQFVVNGGTLEFYNSDNYLGNIVLTGGHITTTGGAWPWRTGYLGNGQITTTASASSSTIAGTLDLVANGATATKTTFTVADGAAADDLAVSAAIRDLPGYAGMTVTKDGPGRMVLSGTNTYAGMTTVSAGTLLVDGSLASPVTVNGGTLGGTGTIGAGGATNVTVNAGGQLSPGMSAGTLTFNLGTGVLNISNVAVQGLLFELGAIGSSDQVKLTSGTLSIGSGLDLDNFQLTAIGGFQLGTYTLFDTPGTIAGSLGPDVWGGVGGYTAHLFFSPDGTDLQLEIVPEPSVLAMLLGLAGIGLAVYLRRRRPA